MQRMRRMSMTSPPQEAEAVLKVLLWPRRQARCQIRDGRIESPYDARHGGMQRRQLPRETEIRLEERMQEFTVTVSGQTTLPKDVRTALQLRPEDRVRYFILDGGEVRLVRSGAVAQLAGFLKGRANRAVNSEQEAEAIAQGAIESMR